MHLQYDCNASLQVHSFQLSRIGAGASDRQSGIVNNSRQKLLASLLQI